MYVIFIPMYFYILHIHTNTHNFRSVEALQRTGGEAFSLCWKLAFVESLLCVSFFQYVVALTFALESGHFQSWGSSR